MTRIVAEVESEPFAVVPPLRHPGRTVGDLLAQSARDIGEGPRRQGARRIHPVRVRTVWRLARLHPRLPLLAFTPIPEVRNQLARIEAQAGRSDAVAEVIGCSFVHGLTGRRRAMASWL